MGYKMNMKFICVLHTPYMHSIKISLWDTFSVLACGVQSVTGSQVWNFLLWYPTQKVWEFGALQILDLQIRDVQPVVHLFFNEK